MFLLPSFLPCTFLRPLVTVFASFVRPFIRRPFAAAAAVQNKLETSSHFLSFVGGGGGSGSERGLSQSGKQTLHCIAAAALAGRQAVGRAGRGPFPPSLPPLFSSGSAERRFLFPFQVGIVLHLPSRLLKQCQMPRRAKNTWPPSQLPIFFHVINCFSRRRYLIFDLVEKTD